MTTAETMDRCEHCGRTAYYAVVTFRASDMDQMRLFAWELRMLADEMRERLERALDRFTDGSDDEGMDE